MKISAKLTNKNVREMDNNKILICVE